MIREWLCAIVPYCLRHREDRSAALQTAAREHSAATAETAVNAEAIKRSGDPLGAITHSMRNALVEKHLLDTGEGFRNGNVPDA